MLPEISFIPICHIISFFDKVNVTIVNISGSHPQVTDQMTVNIHLDMGLVPIVDLSLLHTESAILVNMLLLFLCMFNRLILSPCFLLPLVSFLPKICFDETSILNRSFLYPIPLGIQLALQLIPNQFIHARFCELDP